MDGEAAAALSQIARGRWQAAGGELPPNVRRTAHDPWPGEIAPHFRDVSVGIARTRPSYDETEEVREVEQLFLDAIDAAERFVYIENQFLTCESVAQRLCERMRQRPELEVVFVAPYAMNSWIEENTMRIGRIRFACAFADAGLQDRVRFYCPMVEEGGDCSFPFIHSKVMAVDDRLFRVGSANLNRRSMGTDTECDLAIEADQPATARAIEHVRNSLIAEHCGCAPEEVADALSRAGSAISALDRLAGERRRLRPIDDGEADAGELSTYLQSVADPERPISLQSLLEAFGSGRPRRSRGAMLLGAGGVLVLMALAALWHYAPIAELADPKALRSQLLAFGHTYWAALVVVAMFLAASVIAFPINILIVGVAAAFGPWLGLAYASLGTLASAVVTYAVGRWAGRSLLRDLIGDRLARIRDRIKRRGVVAVAAIRLVPVAPFTLVNLAAGAGDIRFFDFFVGSALGLAPGLIVMSFLGDRATEVLAQPTPANVGLLALGAALWIGIVIGAQVLVSRNGSRVA